MESINGLHQVQIVRLLDGGLLGWAEVNGNSDTAQIFEKRDNVIKFEQIYNIDEHTLIVQVLDIKGNHLMHYEPFTPTIGSINSPKSIFTLGKSEKARVMSTLDKSLMYACQ